MDILPRAAQKNGTILIWVPFKNGQHENKALEVFKSENARNCGVGLPRSFKPTIHWITGYCGDGRVVRTGANIRTAFRMIVRRAQDRTQSRKT
jgi:hypothetical protein